MSSYFGLVCYNTVIICYAAAAKLHGRYIHKNPKWIFTFTETSNNV